MRYTNKKDYSFTLLAKLVIGREGGLKDATSPSSQSSIIIAELGNYFFLHCHALYLGVEKLFWTANQVL